MSDQPQTTESPAAAGETSRAGSPAAARETPREALAAELRRFGDLLVPGAAELIAERNEHLTQLSPEKRAEKIVELLEGKLWATFRNVEHRPPTLENGQPFSVLRATLSRHAPDLKPGAAEALTAAWSAGVAHMTPARLAGEVVRRLADRDNWQYLASPPAAPANEQRLHAFLHHHFPEMQGSKAQDLFVRERARELDPRGRPDREVVEAVAGVLRHPAIAARYGLTPLEPDDARILGRPKGGPPRGPARTPEPARDATGKFQRKAPGSTDF